MIAKSQQKFRSKKHVFTEEVKNIILGDNNDRRIQSIDSRETCAYGTRKDLVCKKEKNKFNNVIKQCKNWLALMMLQKIKKIFQIGCKFLIINRES